MSAAGKYFSGLSFPAKRKNQAGKPEQLPFDKKINILDINNRLREKRLTLKNGENSKGGRLYKMKLYQQVPRQSYRKKAQRRQTAKQREGIKSPGLNDFASVGPIRRPSEFGVLW